ncbi:MAG: DegT/DnrJ/EryC1/StrS family aminotransferase, partial [Mycobacteriaceae bacterium]
NGNKMITTSGGGMLLTHDGELAHQVRYLSTQARQPQLHYEHTDIGFNYRLSNVLAALGRAQLSRADAMLRRRREWRETYRSLLAGRSGVSIVGGADDDHDNCWLTAITVDEAKAGLSATQVGAYLTQVGIESRPLWKPMHLQPVFSSCTRTVNGSSERLFADGLTLPSGSRMSHRDFSLIEMALTAVLDEGANR